MLAPAHAPPQSTAICQLTPIPPPLSPAALYFPFLLSTFCAPNRTRACTPTIVPRTPVCSNKATPPRCSSGCPRLPFASGANSSTCTAPWRLHRNNSELDEASSKLPVLTVSASSASLSTGAPLSAPSRTHACVLLQRVTCSAHFKRLYHCVTLHTASHVGVVRGTPAARSSVGFAFESFGAAAACLTLAHALSFSARCSCSGVSHIVTGACMRNTTCVRSG